MAIEHLQITVHYTNGTAMNQPHPHRNDRAGRVATDKKVFRLLAEPKVTRVEVHPTDKTASTPQRGGRTYR